MLDVCVFARREAGSVRKLVGSLRISLGCAAAMSVCYWGECGGIREAWTVGRLVGRQEYEGIGECVWCLQRSFWWQADEAGG